MVIFYIVFKIWDKLVEDSFPKNIKVNKRKVKLLYFQKIKHRIEKFQMKKLNIFIKSQLNISFSIWNTQKPFQFYFFMVINVEKKLHLIIKNKNTNIFSY